MKKTILVVDDNPSIYLVFQEALGDIYNLKYCEDVFSAIKTMEAGDKVDLCLLDLIMPEETGYELLSYLNRQKLKIPVIVVSAKDSARAAAKAFKSGAVDYIVKPFDMKDVLKTIRDEISKKRS